MMPSDGLVSAKFEKAQGSYATVCFWLDRGMFLIPQSLVMLFFYKYNLHFLNIHSDSPCCWLNTLQTFVLVEAL